jgi:hypothetical protein
LDSIALVLWSFSCDLLDFSGNRNRLKRIRGGESLQKLLNFRCFLVFNKHINFSLALFHGSGEDGGIPEQDAAVTSPIEL